MVVIGLDPGSITFGVGILKNEKNRISYLHSEVIRLKEKEFYMKMKNLWKRLAAIYTSFSVNEAAIEEGFLGKNVKTMGILSRVRGVVMGSLIARDIHLTSYSPREVKLALTGNGNALKSQVNKMIKRLLNLNQMEMGEDESDALAVAYCHILGLK